MKITRRFVVALAVASMATIPCTRAADADTGPDWSGLSFLMGSWVSDDGAARGGTSFEFDLARRIVVRKNFAEYPATGARPASRHDDLMVIYAPAGGQPIRAKYFDNEGHVIDYTVSTTADTVLFIGDIVPKAPRFRLTYRKSTDDRVDGAFEIAKPESPETFQRYLGWSMKRAGK